MLIVLMKVHTYAHIYHTYIIIMKINKATLLEQQRKKATLMQKQQFRQQLLNCEIEYKYSLFYNKMISFAKIAQKNCNTYPSTRLPLNIIAHNR